MVLQEDRGCPLHWDGVGAFLSIPTANKKVNELNRVGGVVLTTSSSSLSYCHSYSDSSSSTYGFR